jgi:ribose transport system permease protein
MLDKKNRKTRVLEAIIKWPQTGISCALIILYLILAFAPTPARDTFFLSGNLVNVLRQSAISIVIGIPITFTMAAGLLDLSIGSLACLGAIVTCAFITGHSSATMEIAPQVPVFAAILIGMFVTGLFGWVNGKVITKLALPPFIVTLAMQEVAKGAVLSFSRGFPVSNLPASVTDMGRGTLLSVPYTVYLMLLLLIVFWVILVKTKFGRHVYAIGGNTECARLSGINVNRTKIIIYVLNGVMACIAGLMVSFRLGSAQTDLGATYGLDAITACCLGGTAMGGGKGYMFGTILGCIFLTSLSTGFNLMNVNTYYQQIIKGVVLVIAIAFNARDKITFRRKEKAAA